MYHHVYKKAFYTYKFRTYTELKKFEKEYKLQKIFKKLIKSSLCRSFASHKRKIKITKERLKLQNKERFNQKKD